jgi:hypothetical protein
MVQAPWLERSRAVFLFPLIVTAAVAACSQPASVATTAEAPAAAASITHDDAIRAAVAAAAQSQPEAAMVTARVDSTTAELVPRAEAEHRIGRVPGTDAALPVWLVLVQGDFRFEGMPQPGTEEHPLHQANERFVILDAHTGQILSRGFVHSHRTN